MMNKAALSILLVDDDQEDYLIIKEILSEIRNAPVRLDWVSSYAEAKAGMEHQRYDAYLVDYRLGEKSGLDLLGEANAVGLTAPVIVLTGYGDREIDLLAMQSGAADYLVKDELTAPLLERSIRYAIRHAETMAKLQARKESVRSLFDAAFEGIIVHEKDGTILDVNRTAAKILGHDPKSLVGTNQLDYFERDLETALVTTADSGLPRTFQTTCRRHDGSSVTLEVTAKPYNYLGKNVILTSLRDISERIQMEAQILHQDRLASVGLLASSLAHEIGTPLGVIRGRAEYLALHPEDRPRVLQCAAIITSEIDRVSKLIRSLLNLARNSGSAAVESLDAGEVTEEVLTLLRHEFERKHIAIENNLGVNRVFVKAEKGPLHQVLLNLLVNAIHAIESAMKNGRKSGHKVHIHAEFVAPNWRISVADTGCGISEANMKNLFKPFFTTKEIGVGTGLGLATSYRIIEGWDGDIRVESESDKGTSFQLFIPAAERPD